MKSTFSVIDIFAGPGGLGEGFSSFSPNNIDFPYKIKLSIEKDVFAHQTLILRAFFRQFAKSGVPAKYYAYLRGEISREDLFNNFPQQYENAKKEAWLIELKISNREKVKEHVSKALNGADKWVLIGGPPCQAYSLVGRSRMIGGNKNKYVRDRRHVLYKEYLQILADLQPPVFVMENVKGLLSSQLKKQSTFELIIADLKNPLGVTRLGTTKLLGYDLYSLSTEKNPEQELAPEDFIVRSEQYGIPQARHRVFIFGVRTDLTQIKKVNTLELQDKQVLIEDVIGDLPALRSGLSKELDTPQKWREAIQSIKSAGWLVTLKPEMQRAITKALDVIPKDLHRGGLFINARVAPRIYKEWYVDPQLQGVCNHETRGHIVEDLHRYFFASVFARLHEHRSPTLADFPVALLPKHKNIKKALSSSMFNDRFRVQAERKPSTTVVSHISKDGHYYIHYDPAQCRSLTVREAARLQTFPDNYFFEGTRTQQYHQVGNAVPPFLANKIAAIVHKVLESI